MFRDIGEQVSPLKGLLISARDNEVWNKVAEKRKEVEAAAKAEKKQKKRGENAPAQPAVVVVMEIEIVKVAAVPDAVELPQHDTDQANEREVSATDANNASATPVFSEPTHHPQRLRLSSVPSDWRMLGRPKEYDGRGLLTYLPKMVRNTVVAEMETLNSMVDSGFPPLDRVRTNVIVNDLMLGVESRVSDTVSHN